MTSKEEEASTNNNDNTTTTPLRPSIILKHHHRTNQKLLTLPKSELQSQIATRGDHLQEIKHAARSTNKLIRSNYSTFIYDVGRNVYPLIIFTDYEENALSGVGSTLTLYRKDGSVTQVSPALSSLYEVYKSCSHIFMGLSIEIGPYLENASYTSDSGMIEDAPWRSSLTKFVHQVRVFRQSLINAAKVEASLVDDSNLTIQEEKKEDEAISSDVSNNGGLPPLEMRECMNEMLSSVINYCEDCLSTGVLDTSKWEQLNQENFPCIKQCMTAATKAQAEACVRQLISWRDMLGPSEWRELYCVIPTVWAVGAENPRKTMMRQLMDKDRIDTHIITSEYPRNHAEARTLLGRVVADRAIGRLVFGDETKEQRIKTMGLSSEVDVVQDDSLLAIWEAIKSNGCPVRRPPSSNTSSRETLCVYRAERSIGHKFEYS